MFENVDAQPCCDGSEQNMYINGQIVNDREDDDRRQEDSDFLFHCVAGFRKGL